MRRRDVLAATVGAIAATALAGGLAWAAIPGDGGVIQGCYDSGGNLKVVAALGGGASASLPAAFGLADVSQSYPFVDAGAEGWAAALHNGSDPGEQLHPVGFRIYAICATAG